MKFTVEGDDGTPIEFECADTLVSRWLCREILVGTTYPYLPFVDDVRVVFDVGANCGSASVYFALHYPGAEIHSFEPGSEPRAILERNARSRPNVTVHPIGLNSADARVPLYKGDGDTGLGSVFQRSVNLGESEPVELRAGAAWARDNGITHIDVLKVDVEGNEIPVLEGLAGLVATAKVIYVEYDSRGSRRQIERMLEPSHELFMGLLFLDQGEAIYVRKDYAARESAQAHLLEIRRVRREREAAKA